MRGFILAAGYGTRLRPLTDFVPKPLVPIVNIPAIAYSVALLREAGINDIICNVHYKHKDIIACIEKHEGWGAGIRFSYEETLLGTGGGLKKCEDMLGDDEFILLNSDVLIDIDLQGLIDHHAESGHPATIVIKHHDRAREIAPLGIKGGEVVDFKNHLKTGMESDYIYIGAALLTPEIFRYLSPEFSSVVYTGYVDLIRHRSLGSFVHEGFWYDIGSIQSYLDVNTNLITHHEGFLERIGTALGTIPEGVHSNAVVDGSSKIVNSVIGAECVIGKRCTIRDSVVLPQSVVPDYTRIMGEVFAEGGILKP